MKISDPTPYADVNEILEILRINAKNILGDQFIGMYLYGSLSSGDFNPTTSDIDFVVVTQDSLAEVKIAEIKSMHECLWATGLKRAERLEGSYVPTILIRHHNSEGEPCPTVNERKFFVAKLGSDWIIQRHIVREFGMIIEGPDPKMLIDFVRPGEIREAVIGLLNEWWFPMLEDESWLRKHKSNYHGYAVISMCRALHALQHGAIVSKPVAVQWAWDNLNGEWHGLFSKAIASQYGEHSEFLEETLKFMRFTRDQIVKGEKAIPDAESSS